jgi:hypothetical protein
MMKILKQVLLKAFNFSKLSQKKYGTQTIGLLRGKTISFESQFPQYKSGRIVEVAEIIEDNCFI